MRRLRAGASLSEHVTASTRPEARGGEVMAGRYKVDTLIARGGMATVYLAHHVQLNRPIALKILTPPPDSEEAASFQERFRLEAETLAQLDHPHIVTLHDFGEIKSDGRFFLAMEFVDGPRLSDLLTTGPLPPARALGLLVQVCTALRYAHRRGVVHRDLKPSNLLIRADDDGNDHVKVVDFGLVKLTRDDQSITRAGLILGSPHCMAPEQVKGLDIDHRADIYAIGVLLFRTITGQYPFHGANSAATMIAHLNEEVPTFCRIVPELEVPEGLEDITRTCLAKSPADRFSDMGSLIDALAACSELPPDAFRTVAQSQSTLRNPAGVSDNHGRAVGTGVGLVAVAAAVGAVVLLGGLLVGAVVGGFVGSGAATAPGSRQPASVAAQPTPQLAPPTPTAPAVAPPSAPDGSDLATARSDPGTAEAAAASTGDDSEAEAHATAPPTPVAAPQVAPKPRPAVAAAPTAKPAPPEESSPAPVAATEPEATSPEGALPPEAVEPEPEGAAPEGYMGMPDELFE